MKWSKDDAGRQGFLKILESGSLKLPAFLGPFGKCLWTSHLKTIVLGHARTSGRRQSEARGKEAGSPTVSTVILNPSHS